MTGVAVSVSYTHRSEAAPFSVSAIADRWVLSGDALSASVQATTTLQLNCTVDMAGSASSPITDIALSAAAELACMYLT